MRHYRNFDDPTRFHFICIKCQADFTSANARRYCPECRVKTMAVGIPDPESSAEMSGS